ncbi:MAG: hypothetical protein KGJ75_07995 [Alphaproteobacteria bacterium]|nr:hypothetical protein [Alphaproteobacteria bacterium]
MDRARALDPAQAAAEAVKAYVRLNRARLAGDGELLAMLLPERFAGAEVRDLQRFVIERLAAENAVLKAEREGLTRKPVLGEGVRRLVLELIDARTFEEAIEVAVGSAAAFGAERAALCVEGEGAPPPVSGSSVRLIVPGLTAALLGRDGSGAILSSGGELLLGPGGSACKSLAAFRLRIGAETPAAIYVLGARAEGRFDGEETASDLGFFARALERAIRAWLDLPKR